MWSWRGTLVALLALTGAAVADARSPTPTRSSTATSTAGAAGCNSKFPPSPSTDPSTLATYHVTAGGETYDYLLYVPAGIEKPVPVLVALHAITNQGLDHAQQTHFATLAAQDHFLVAFPNSFGTLWSSYFAHSTDSMAVYAIARTLIDAGCADPKRVLVEGHSEGAYMADRVACDATTGRGGPNQGVELHTAAAYAGGDITGFGGSCPAATPVAWASFNGSADTVIPPAAGYDAAIRWAIRDSCPGAPAQPPSSGSYDPNPESYTGCARGTSVQWHPLPGQSHAWPEAPCGPDFPPSTDYSCVPTLTRQVWAFLSQ